MVNPGFEIWLIIGDSFTGRAGGDAAESVCFRI
jgi:hypothetical protein